MKIPSNNRWVQTNSGDVFGTLNETHNISFDSEGKAKLTRKAVAHKAETAATDANFELPLAFLYYNSDIVAVTDDDVYTGEADGSGFSAIASSPNLFPGTDGVVFNNLLYVSDSTSLSHWNATTWTNNVISGLTSNKPHPLEIFESQATHQLAIGDVSQVKVYDSSHVAGTHLTIPDNYEVTCLTYFNQFLYVGTKDINGGEARIFIWDGSSAAADYSVPVGGSWIMAMKRYKGSVVCITDEGELLRVSGASAQRLAAFPVFYEQGARWFTGSSAIVGKVTPNGIAVIGDVIYINIDGEVESGHVASMKSGVWVFDPEVGLYHYSGHSVDEVRQETGLTRSGNQLTTSADHGLKTGDAVLFNTIGGLTGVTNDVVYYAVVVDADTISLAGNRFDADQGNLIELGGTPNGADELFYTPNTDLGSIFRADPGAVGVISFKHGGSENYATDIVWGADIEDQSGTDIKIICGFSDQLNVGWFTTQKIYSQNISQTWKSVNTFLSGAHTAEESVIVKYKTEDTRNLPTRDVIVTWTGGTTFTSTDFMIRGNVQVGDEIMVIEGRGQGRLVHVSAIDTSTSTTVTTVTVDESIGVNTDTARVVVTGFKKLATSTSSRPHLDHFETSIGQKSAWIQLKVELRGFGIEVPMLDLSHGVDKSAV